MRPMRAATGADDMSTCFLTGPPFKFAGRDSDAHKGYVYGVAFSPDGNRLVSVGGDKRIVLYDGKTGERVSGATIEGAHSGSIFSVAWNKDSRRVVTASADKTVKVWDVEAGKAVQTWTLGSAIPDQQVGVTWTPRADGTIISINLAGDLIYLNEGTEVPSRVVQGHNKNITAMATSPFASGSPTIWTGSFDGRVCAWDSASGTATAVTGAGHGGQITAFAPAQGGDAYSVAWDDAMRLIPSSSAEFSPDSVALGGQPKSAAVAGDTVYVATVSGIQAYTNGKLKSEQKTSYTPAAIAASLSFVAVADGTTAIRILSPSSLSNEITVLDHAPSAVSALALSPNGKLLAAGTNGGKIVVFRTEDWKVETTRWGAHTARITSIAWNEASTHAVSGSLDTHVHVWSVAKPGERVAASNAHKDGVSGVGWLAEDKVVSTGGDATVKVWSVTALK